MRYSLLPAVLLMLGCARPEPAAAQTLLDVAPFRSVALSGGGHVTIRHGAVQRVTLVEGEADVAVEGARLRIGRCHECPRRSRPHVEIVVSRLDAAAVDNGGRLVLEGEFPSQAQLATAVSNGGMLDVRALAAERVTASVAQGGMIFTRPLQRLEAAVSQGGAITYWGEPQVQRAISHGGVVQRGRREDAERPIEDMMPRAPAVSHPPKLQEVGD